MSSMNEEDYFLKAKEFDVRSQHYKYTDPELYIKYYYRHLHYFNQLPRQKVLTDRFLLGSVRFFHALPPVKNIDVYLNGIRIFKDIPTKSVSHYFSLPQGKYQIDLYP